MKNLKNFIKVLLSLVMLLCATCFVACGQSNAGSGSNGTYYLYENGQLDKSGFIKLDGGKWSDDDNESGTYVVSGDTVTIYIEIDGEKEEFAEGTLKNGVLTLTIKGETVVYCQEGKTPSKPSEPDNPSDPADPSRPSETIDDGHSVISSSECEINNNTLTAYIVSIDGTYDLRDKFKVSDGASWRAFTSADCLQPTELTKRVADVEYGWNDVYVMVENQTTYESTVYDFKIYRAPVSSLTLLDDGTYCVDKGVDFPEVIIPSKYNGKIITTIGQSVFEDCSKLTSVTIPDSVTSIDEYAFYDCSGLTSVTIGNGVTSIGGGAFSGCSGITSITIPNSVTFIGYSAFEGCSKLTSITIPNSVVSIGQGAFTYCYKLVEVVNNSSLNITKGSSDNGDVAYYALNVKNGGSSDIVNQNGYLFYTSGEKNYLLGYVGNSTDLKLPETYNGNNYEIYKYAFKNCSELTNVEIPDSVVSIGDEAFYGCNSLESITLPFVGANLNGDKNTYFGYIFGVIRYNYGYEPGNLNLKTVIINNNRNIFTIDDDAFRGCSKLTSVTIGKGVTSIGGDAFQGCSGLMSVTIGDGVTSIGGGAFYGCSGLTSMTIGNGVTSIGDDAFGGCSGLTSITIPDSVTSIGGGAFGGCSGLMSVTIPDSVTSIGDSAFSGCSGLTSVTVGDKVTSIGFSAFGSCSKLESITLPFADTYMGYIFGSRDRTDMKYTKLVPSSLKTVIISGSSGVTSIGDYAFYNFGYVTSITIPNTVTSIGKEAFYRCSKLESITLPFIGASKNADKGYDQVFGYIFGYDTTKQSDETFPGATYQWYSSGTSSGTYYHYYIPSSLRKIVLSDSVTYIGEDAFRGCSGLTSILIPDSVTYIGEDAFRGCSGLTSITIPDSVTSIGSWAFIGCSGLEDIFITDIAAWCKISGLSNLMGVGSSSKKLYLNNELITNLVIPNSVTSIGEGAFYNCSGLTSVTIGNSVTSIGGNAFRDCSKLTSVIIGNGVTSIGSGAFYGCSELTSVTIPDSVTSIGGYAFEDCSSLTSVTIGNGVTSIGEDAFSGCSGLTSITIPDSVTSIGSRAFSDCSRLTSVLWNAENCTTGCSTYSSYSSIFYGCSSLRLTIGDNVKIIPFYAFSCCSGLTSVTIGKSVTSIGVWAFYNCGLTSVVWNAENCTVAGSFDRPIFRGCSRLTSVMIGSNAKTIPSSAFYGCSGLTSVTIGNSVTSIGGNAFRDCSKLTSITIPDSVTSIDVNAFRDCSKLTSVIIGNGVTSIGKSAFYGCSKLESITLPFIGAQLNGSENTHFGYIFGASSYSDNSKYIPSSLKTVIISNNSGVTSIGDYALYNCSGLTSIVIPDSVTSIGSDAFYRCSVLTSVTIGNGVTSIGNYAFGGCNKLTAIRFSGTVSQWKTISKGEYWRSGVPISCKIICSNGEASL